MSLQTLVLASIWRVTSEVEGSTKHRIVDLVVVVNEVGLYDKVDAGFETDMQAKTLLLLLQSPDRFVTGFDDRRVHLWSDSRSLEGTTRSHTPYHPLQRNLSKAPNRFQRSCKRVSRYCIPACR